MSRLSDHQSPRVNAARLPDFIGRTVRLPCKVLSQDARAGQAIVEACDQGQVGIRLMGGVPLKGTFVEVIGRVEQDLNIKLLRGLDLGSDKDVDMQLVNDVIELTFDPRFKKMFFAD